MAEIISVLSGKGGVGKTLFTGTFGCALARDGKRVLLIDGDMGMRNLDLLFGVENEIFYNIWDVAQGKCFISDAVVTIDKGVDFLGAAHEESWEDLFPGAVDTVIDDIKDVYDYVLIDCPAGMGKGINFAKDVSEKCLIIVDSSWASKRNADKLLTSLPRYIEAYLVLNRFTRGDTTKVSFSDMMETVDIDSFGGVIPYSKMADQLSHEGRIKDVQFDTVFGRALQMVKQSILEQRVYSFASWSSLLGREIEKTNDCTEGRIQKKGLTWQSSGRSYKWQRRRG